MVVPAGTTVETVIASLTVTTSAGDAYPVSARIDGVVVDGNGAESVAFAEGSGNLQLIRQPTPGTLAELAASNLDLVAVDTPFVISPVGAVDRAR